MNRAKTISGHELLEIFAAGTEWLAKNARDIDALNVFPVPDGDTGTNMLLTMRSCIEEARRTGDGTVSEVVRAMAQGALMGARGNSGVIMSQFWSGLSEGLKGKDIISGSDLAQALAQASKAAYSGLTNPVEGTILTVIREAATAAKKRTSNNNGTFASVLEVAVSAARESVANTPALLPVLRDAGVVDAGGQGLYTLLEGALIHLSGESKMKQFSMPQVIVSSISTTTPTVTTSTEEKSFGYCTEFLLEGNNLDPDEIRRTLVQKGESLIVVGSDTTVRVHIHTLNPNDILDYGKSLGTLQNISIRNMDEQHKDFIVMQKERAPVVDTSLVAVVAGDGLIKVFTSLGVSAIVPGGQTMNPSTGDILQAVKEVPTDKVIILPNNQNVVLTAKQVKPLTRKKVEIVPSKTIAQGVSALISFNPEENFESNVETMTQTISTVKTIEITHATHSARINGLDIKENQSIGLLDGELLAAGDNDAGVIITLLSKIDLEDASIITIYYGASANQSDAEEATKLIRSKYPSLETEVVYGGQPHYNYIISLE